MADGSYQEKTEAPTPKRRRDAQERGQIARSGEVGTAILLLAAAGAVSLGGGSLATALAGVFGSSTRVAITPPVGLEATAGWLREIGWSVLAALAPVVLGISGLVLAAGAIQARGTFSWKPVQPDWSRFAPHRNLRRLFSTRPFFELAKSLLKLGIVGFAVHAALDGAWREIVALPQQAPTALLDVLRRRATDLFRTAGLAFLALAAVDYAYQLRSHEKGLRMTREEVKQENKETEGDPMVKSRLRALGRSLARRRMLRDVPRADVVVANPTHIAVALKYDPSIAPAPVVLALGQRKVAERIKAIAHEAGVPVVENRPLARALLATARVGLPIPPELYVAVAEVLAFVIRRRSAGSARWHGEAVVQ